jgi:hypothetical protein
MTQEFTQHPTCDLCKAQKMTPWFHEDDTCWIAECDICAVPMVVWRFHGPCPPDEHLAHMRARIAEVAAGIRSGAFAPKENRLCDWCDYQASCPLFAHRFQQEETPIDIGSAVDEWIAAKRRLRADASRVEELSEVIHRYCETTGLERLFGEDGAVTRYTQSEAVYHEETVRRALEPLDLLHRVTQLDAAAIDALLESGLPDDVAAALREARTEQVVHALRLRDSRRR